MQVARLQCHAAGGRTEARPRQMDKNGAASAGHAWPRIMIDLDNNIVEAILPPQPIAWFNGRPLKWTVVAPVPWILAPGVGAADPAGRQRGPWRRKPIRPPPQSQRPERAPRGTAIAFAFVGFHTAAAECDRHAPGAGAEPALRWPAGPRPDMDGSERGLLHVWSGGGDFPTAACSCILTCSTSRQIAEQSCS